jgi:SAM-dependent methyltransferase
MKVCIYCDRRSNSDDWLCPECGQEPPRHGRVVQLTPRQARAGEGYSPDYFAELFQLESGNYWFRSRNRLLTWALGSYFPTAARFLEIGCGTGFVLSGIQKAFPHLELLGSELFREGLTIAEQRMPGVTLLEMDARSIPYEMEFDVIGAFDVIEHIEDDELVLSQLFRATKPGGGIMITVPQHQFLWSIVDEHAFHKRRYSRKDLVMKVERAGFHVVRTTSFVSLLLPLLLLSRRRRDMTRAKYDPRAEYNISKTLNRGLEKVLGVERFAIEKGVSFTAGGSLLLIAVREAE